MQHEFLQHQSWPVKYCVKCCGVAGSKIAYEEFMADMKSRSNPGGILCAIPKDELVKRFYRLQPGEPCPDLQEVSNQISG